MIAWEGQESNWPLYIGFHNLSLGRACLRRGTKTRQQLAAEPLEIAVNGLEESGRLDHQPPGLLARAELHRTNDNFNEARNDINRAFAIAKRGLMRLHEIDCDLEYARLFYPSGQPEDAKRHCYLAEGLIRDTHYHRRQADLNQLRQQLTDLGNMKPQKS